MMTERMSSSDAAMILNAVDYIEANLEEKLSVDMISREVGFSKFHFSRLFDKYVGMSPYDYYRGRKVTETVRYLQSKQCRIIDAALHYGFSSPEVFVRACKAVFGCAPSAIRRQLENGTFKGIDRPSESNLYAQVETISWEIRFLPEITLSGVGYFSNQMEDVLKALPMEQLSVFTNAPGNIYMLSWLDKGPMGYMHFVGVDGIFEGEQVLSKSIPKMSYIVFRLKMDAKSLTNAIRYIYDKLLDELGFEQPLPYHLEHYDEEKDLSYLYVPVIPKE